jgi:hypothetical protein
MISTHNHVDMAASSVGAGQLKLTLLPPTRASNSVTARPPPGPGSTAALCAGSRDPDTPRQASRSGLAGRGARPAADHAQAPVGLSPSGPRPASPVPTTATSTTREEDSGRREPTRRDHSDPDRRGMARPSEVCPAWAGEQSKRGGAETQWQTPRRRRRADGARLRRNPYVCRGRLHRPALPVQPRSVLRDPPRMGSAEGDSAAATPLLSCWGPMVSSTRWPLQRGHPWRS